jgi:thioredoxin 1
MQPTNAGATKLRPRPALPTATMDRRLSQGRLQLIGISLGELTDASSLPEMRHSALSIAALWLVANSCHSSSRSVGGRDFCVEALAMRDASRPTVAYFWTTWAGPAIVFRPTLERGMAEHPAVLLRNVDVDAETALAKACGVRKVPTLKGVRDGRVAGTLIGAVSKAQLDLFLDSLSTGGPRTK